MRNAGPGIVKISSIFLIQSRDTEWNTITIQQRLTDSTNYMFIFICSHNLFCTVSHNYNHIVIILGYFLTIIQNFWSWLYYLLLLLTHSFINIPFWMEGLLITLIYICRFRSTNPTTNLSIADSQIGAIGFSDTLIPNLTLTFVS